MDSFKNVLAQNLTMLLRLKGISQTELANRLHVDRASVSYWMHGKKVPRADKIDEICKALGCRREDLLGASSSEEEYHLGQAKKELMKDIDTLTEEGIRRLQAYIKDLNDVYKKKGGESEDPPKNL